MPKQKILCVIPARFQSSRFPGKLLAKAAGKSVLERTYSCAASAKRIDDLFIATNDERIADHAASFGAKVLWTTKEWKNGTQRIAEALRNEPKLQSAPIILNLQGDHPLTSPSTLDSIANLLLEDPAADVATAARPIRSREDFLSPHVVKCVIGQHKQALYFSRSPIPWSKNGFGGYQHIGLYGYRTSFLMKITSLPDTDLQQLEDLEQLQFLELGYRIRVALVEDEALGVDTPEDLVKLENLLLCQSNTSLSPAALSPRLAKA